MENLLGKYVPMALFFAFIVKLMVFGASGPEMGVALGLMSLLGVQEWFAFKRDRKLQDVIDTVMKQNEVIAKMAAEVADHKNQISTLKTVNGFKKAM